MEAQPPWIILIYGFQGVFRPQRVLLGGHGITTKFKPPPWKIPVYAPSVLHIYIKDTVITISFFTKLSLNL